MDETTASLCSKAYWSKRYRAGGGSGAWPYGRLAEFKGKAANNFVSE